MNLKWGLGETNLLMYSVVDKVLQEAMAFYKTGQIDETERICQEILHSDPDSVDALHLLGVVAYQVGKYDVAVDLIAQAIEIDSGQAIFFNSLGLGLKEQLRLEEAVEAYHRALEINPDYSEACNNLGTVFYQQSRFLEAVEAYQRSVRINPRYCEAYNNLGLLFQEQENFDQAIEAYRCALEINPDYSEACNNLGTVLQRQEDFDQAIVLYRHAVTINPKYCEAYNNLGLLFQEQGRLKEGIEAYKCALKIHPQFANAHSNLAKTLFLQGDFRNAWKEYEWRWECRGISFSLNKRHFPQPLWDGSNLSRRTILVWAEQGIGDEIMFSSMLPNLLKMNPNVIVECDKRLVPLFQRSFLNVQFVPREDPTNPKLLDTTIIDYQIPMGSLGQWLRVDEDAFLPKQESYLQACPNKTRQMQKKYRELADDKLLVGISWKSTGIDKKRAHTKNVPLKYWIPILSRQDCYFISLQYGDIREDIEEHTSAFGSPIYIDEEIDSLENLDDFAAQVSALDLIISTSNATVHVAGGLGKRVWVLLSSRPDWRWMLDRDDSPWYQTVRLFRQEKLGDLKRMLRRVNFALGKDCRFCN